MSSSAGIRAFTVPAFTALALASLLGAEACSGPGHGLPADALHDAIAAGVGDPNTCVLLAERRSGKVVYRYGDSLNCARDLPACDRPGAMSATQALALAATPGGRAASCPSNPDGSRMVGWAQGRVESRSRDLVYSAMMEGQQALPGHEIAARLDLAFLRAGL